MTMKARVFLLITLGGGFLVAHSVEVDPRKSDFVHVPDVILMELGQAEDTLGEVYLHSETTRKHSNTVPFDHVISQDPEPEVYVLKSTTVTLIVSDGPGEVVEETQEEEVIEETPTGGCGRRSSKTSLFEKFFLIN